MDFNETFCVDMWMEIIVLSTPEPNHVKQKLDVELFRKDMPTIVIVYRLSVYISLCLTVASLYLPEMTVHTSFRRTRNNLPMSINREVQPPYRQQRPIGQDSSTLNKRSAYRDFSNVMARHANRHNNDKLFVDRLFRLFDLDDDKVIEHREFKAVLKILGIVSHNI